MTAVELTNFNIICTNCGDGDRVTYKLYCGQNCAILTVKCHKCGIEETEEEW